MRIIDYPTEIKKDYTYKNLDRLNENQELVRIVDKKLFANGFRWK